MRSIVWIFTASAAFAALCQTVVAGAPNTLPTEKSLSARAKVDRASAERIALARFPGGRVQSGELEREHGQLIWSFDIAVRDSQNIWEVQINAITGRLVSVTTETVADQAKEAAGELTLPDKK